MNNKIDFRALANQYDENCERMRAIADACQNENRSRNDSEDAEYAALTMQNQQIQMRMQLAANVKPEVKPVKSVTELVRENIKNGERTDLLFRDSVTTDIVDAGGIIPLKVQDVLKPLKEGFILDKVGLPFLSGLAGTYVWPTYEMVEATIAGEGVELGDTALSMSKLTATPERIGIAIPVTRQAINQSEGLIENIIREIMPLSLRYLLNDILFSTTLVDGAELLKGPFVDIASGSATYADGTANSVVSLSATPTFEELNVQMKAALLETGIEGGHLCWVMTKSMEATLEGTPINSNGIFVPMIQGHTLCGLPVYTTNSIRDGETEYIGLGDWAYQPMGLFGDIRFIVDPYTKSRADSVDFVLNADYGTKTLRTEAFKLGKCGS